MTKLTKKSLVIDTVVVSLATLLAYLLLVVTGTAHFFLFLIPVPIAIFTIKYEDAIASIPLGLIVAFSPFILKPFAGELFDAKMQGFVVLTVTALVGILHGYIAERHMKHQLRLLLIILTDIIANYLILFVFSSHITGEPFSFEVKAITEEILELLSFMNFSETFKTFALTYAEAIVPAIIIVTGVVEAVLTHATTHALAKRVFKLEYGHTFSGIHMFIPRLWSIVFLPLIVATAIGAFFFASALGVWKVFLIIGFNIFAISYVFYVLEGFTTVVRFIACRYHKRMYLWPTIAMLLFSPLFYILGIIDSFFLLQPHLRVHLHSSYKKQAVINSQNDLKK
jgi:hypothetical protein